jgi:uncharacterized membrane protein
VKLLAPFAVLGIFLGAVLASFGAHAVDQLAQLFLVYWVNPAGKETAIPLALSPASRSVSFPGLGTVQGMGLDPALTWVFLVTVDFATCLFFVWNYDHARKVPYLGRFLARAEDKGKKVAAKHAWIPHLAFGGLTIYAVLPLEGTGGIGGSVLGRAIGLAPLRTFLAVGLGSVVRTTLTMAIVLGAFAVLA